MDEPIPSMPRLLTVSCCNHPCVGQAGRVCDGIWGTRACEVVHVLRVPTWWFGVFASRGHDGRQQVVVLSARQALTRLNGLFFQNYLVNPILLQMCTAAGCNPCSQRLRPPKATRILTFDEPSSDLDQRAECSHRTYCCVAGLGPQLDKIAQVCMGTSNVEVRVALWVSFQIVRLVPDRAFLFNRMRSSSWPLKNWSFTCHTPSRRSLLTTRLSRILASPLERTSRHTPEFVLGIFFAFAPLLYLSPSGLSHVPRLSPDRFRIGSLVARRGEKRTNVRADVRSNER